LTDNGFIKNSLVYSDESMSAYDFVFSNNHIFRVTLSIDNSICVCYMESLVDNEKQIHLDRFIVKTLNNFNDIITNLARSPLFSKKSLALS